MGWGVIVMSRRRSLLVLAAGVSILLLPLLAAPAAAKSEHQRILDYWTSGRMAAARPLDLTPTDRVNPAAKGGKPGPPGGGGGGGGGTDVTGASWTNGGPVLNQTGKVWFHMPNGDYICSGSIINDTRTNYSIVLTAGHCAYDFSSGFVTNWMFIPNFDANPTYTCANTTYGCWTAQALVIHYGFRYAGSFNNQAVTHDWAFAVVGAAASRAPSSMRSVPTPSATAASRPAIASRRSATRLPARTTAATSPGAPAASASTSRRPTVPRTTPPGAWPAT
jgi:hypothetical protein